MTLPEKLPTCLAVESAGSPPGMYHGGRIDNNGPDGVNNEGDEKRPQAGVHWLRVSLPSRKLGQAVRLFRGLFGAESEYGGGLWGYQESYRWKSGAAIAYDRDQKFNQATHRECLTVEIPGGALDLLEGLDLVGLILTLKEMGGRCTRFDAFLDDYERLIEPDGVKAIYDKGDVSGFRTGSQRQEWLCVGVLKRNEFTFGSRGENGTGKYLRVYDKYLESKGRLNAVRWEVELSQERAEQAFEAVVKCDRPDSVALICGQLVCGSVDFIHRKQGEQHVDRQERYAFWEKLCGGLGRLKMRVVSKEDSLVAKMLWFEGQVATTLAMIREGYADSRKFGTWLWKVMEQGKQRMADEQWAVVERSLAERKLKNERFSDGAPRGGSV
jgi:hypothetical protein